MPLAPERGTTARARIREALAGVAALSEALFLECEVHDVSASIRAMMSTSCANLMDARTTSLPGYGRVDQALAPLLDPMVERLADLALAISALMKAD
jgi:hypothetical protein